MSICRIRYLIILAIVLSSLLLTQCGSGHAVFCAGPCSSASGATEFLYVTSTSHGGQILSFPVDHNSGTLGTSTAVSGPASASGIASAQNQFIYVADNETGAIDAFVIDPNTGTLTVVPGSPFSDSSQTFPPQWLVAGPAVYTTAENGITGFTIASNGVLGEVVGSPYPGGFSGQAVLAQTNTTPVNTFLYATNFLDPKGAISVFQIVAPASGILTPVPGDFTTGASTGPGAIVFAGTSPTSFIFVALNNSKQIATFLVDSSTGALNPVPGSPLAVGFSPTSLALNAEQTFLYALNSSEGAISVFRIASSGSLSPIGGSPFTVGQQPCCIAVTADNYLYVTLPESNEIQGFTISSANGGLAPLTTSPFPALEPRLLTVVQTPAP